MRKEDSMNMHKCSSLLNLLAFGYDRLVLAYSTHLHFSLMVVMFQHYSC